MRFFELNPSRRLEVEIIVGLMAGALIWFIW